MTNRRLLPALGLTVVATIALAGCGSNGSDHPASSSNMSSHDMSNMPSSDMSPGASSEPSGNHNQQDVTFAQEMIPHHRQAIAMAKLAQAHAGSAQVKQLAARIEGAQGPEIKTMTTWLKEWGAKPGMDGMDGMPGMMSPADMKGLANAAPKRFDAMFLRGMITHHQGAVKMAEDEISKGKNPNAIALAKRIEIAQTKEITEMRHLIAD